MLKSGVLILTLKFPSPKRSPILELDEGALGAGALGAGATMRGVGAGATMTGVGAGTTRGTAGTRKRPMDLPELD